jgi:putative flippase GtrA
MVTPPAPTGEAATERHSTVRAVVRFLVTGGLSYLVDVATFSLAHYGVGLSVPVATTVAYLVTFVVNFRLNQRWVFRSAGSTRKHVARYLVLVGVNYLLTLALMVLLVDAGVEAVLAKTLTTAIIAVLNFVTYRVWVFR